MTLGRIARLSIGETANDIRSRKLEGGEMFSEFQKSKKEVVMKRTVVVLLALFLSLPAVSFAGSATSRWDLTIGGYVKFDMGYNTQAQGVDAQVAQRYGNGPYENYADRYGNYFSYAGETRLNFLTKGPDAFGAKTSAFVEGHFRGADAGSGSGAFVLRHAFMQLQWPTSKLIIGQTYQKWGFLPTHANQLLEYNGLNPFLKGSRQPLIRFEQDITKNWNWAVGAISPTNTLNQAGTGAVDAWTLSQMPFYEGTFSFTTDKCGKIGAWQMLFSLDGFYGQRKDVTGVTTANYIAYASKNSDAYGVAFKGFVPVIPEKKGNKQGALSVSGIVFYMQNPSWFDSSGVNGYAMPNYGATAATVYLDPQYHAPTIYGGWIQGSYYIKDNLWVNAWYGYLRNNLSSAYMYNPLAGTVAGTPVAGATTIQNTSQIIANIMYDANQAIRFGFEYSYYQTRYAAPTGTAAQIATYGGTTQKDGSMHMFRLGAYYFF